MRRGFSVLVCCLLAGYGLISAGEPSGKSTSDFFPSPKVYKYWIEFTDKKNSAYSIDKPAEFLSERCLSRRKKQNVPVTVEDIPVNLEYIQGITTMGPKLLNRSRWFNAISVQMDDTTRLARIRALPYVKKVTLLGYFDLNAVPERELNEYDFLGDFSDDHPESYYGAAHRQIEMLNGINMHNMGYKGQGMLIAVLDAGFLKGNLVSAFDSIRLNKQIRYTYDFVTGNHQVFDDDDHGLSVLSCMAANAPHRIVGTAPAADFLLLRTEDDGSEFPVEETNWVAAAEFADSAGADIINSSLGYNYTEEPDTRFALKYEQLDGKSTIVSRAAFLASTKGMLVVNAAGNEGDKAWHYIGVPADADNIITVGAVDSRLLHAGFSSYGPTADGRIKPTVSAMGERAMVVSPRNTVYPANGTSFSAPVLCGLVACLWQACPDRSAREVMDAIVQSGSKYTRPDNSYGYGVPDFMVALTILGGNRQFDYAHDQWVEQPHTEGRNLVYHFYATDNQEASVKLINPKGKEVFAGKISCKAGFNKSTLPLGRAPRGNFTVQITTRSGSFNKNIEL